MLKGLRKEGECLPIRLAGKGELNKALAMISVNFFE